MSLAIFIWQALTEDAQVKQGEMLAQRRREVIERLFTQGLHPLRIRLHKHLRARHWQTREKIRWLEQLTTLLQAGLPLVRSLNMLADDHPLRHWRCLLNDLAARVEQGAALSETLEHYAEVFPPVYGKTIATAELTGSLDLCCQALARQQKQTYALSCRLRKALRYPLIVCATALLVTLVMLIGVLPQFAELYRSFDAPLPWFTLLLLRASRFITRYAPAALPILIISAMLLYHRFRRVPRWRQAWQRFLFRLPLLRRIITATNLGQFFYTLSMTQKAGLPLLNGLDNAGRAIDHVLFRQASLAIADALHQGEAFSTAVSRQPVLPHLCFQLIRVGEESGALDTLLENLAEHYQQQAYQIGDTLAHTAEPLMMVVIGIIVGALVMAMYLPIFQLGGVLG